MVAEGMLAGRRVVTSSVCPALAYVRDAVIEVPPDDVQGYGDAVLALAENPELYAAKRRGCRRARAQFYDPTRGWGAALRHVLRALGEGRQPEPTSWLQGHDVTDPEDAGVEPAICGR